MTVTLAAVFEGFEKDHPGMRQDEKHQMQVIACYFTAPVAAIKHRHIKDFANALPLTVVDGKCESTGRKLADGTRNRYLASLSTLLKSYKEDYDEEYQPPAIPWRKEVKHHQRTLTDEEVEAIIRHMPSKDGFLFRLLDRTGMRAGELLKQTRLEYLEDEYIVLPAAVIKNDMDRTIWIGKQESEILRNILRLKDMPSYWTFRDRVLRAAFLAKVPDPGRILHSMRHRRGTATAAEDIPLDHTMAVMGWKSVATAMRYRKIAGPLAKRISRQVLGKGRTDGGS